MTTPSDYDLSVQLQELGREVQSGKYDAQPDLKCRAQELLNAHQRQQDQRPAVGVHDPWPAVERSAAPTPTVFASGDLPPFTASGVDPQMLRGLPPLVRRAAAAEPDAARVLRVVEYVAQHPAGGAVSTEGLKPGDHKLLSGGDAWPGG